MKLYFPGVLEQLNKWKRHDWGNKMACWIV